MSEEQTRLSRLSTIWTTVRKAHQSDNDEVASDANLELIERYQGAVYRYLLGAVRDIEAADELFQEFALRVVTGRFSKASEERGRFRDYLRTSLIRMVADYQRAQKKAPFALEDNAINAIRSGEDNASERFKESWRDELLHICWNALEAYEKGSGNPFHSVLKLRVDRPDLRSRELAELLNQRTGCEDFSDTRVRKIVQRARNMFAELLIFEVTQTIESSEKEDIERELIDLGLLEYCKSAL